MNRTRYADRQGMLVGELSQLSVYQVHLGWMMCGELCVCITLLIQRQDVILDMKQEGIEARIAL